jgi:hypothetical protein
MSSDGIIGEECGQRGHIACFSQSDDKPGNLDIPAIVLKPSGHFDGCSFAIASSNTAEGLSGMSLLPRMFGQRVGTPDQRMVAAVSPQAALDSRGMGIRAAFP